LEVVSGDEGLCFGLFLRAGGAIDRRRSEDGGRERERRDVS
jgi:hypothetical protein